MFITYFPTDERALTTLPDTATIRLKGLLKFKSNKHIYATFRKYDFPVRYSTAQLPSVRS